MCFCSFADFGRATLAAWSVCLSACGCARICFQVAGRCMCVYSCMQLLCVFSCWFLVLKVIEHIHPSLHGCYGNSKRKLNVKLYFEKTFNRPWTPSSDYTVLYTSLSYAPLPSESAAFLHFSFLGPEMWISSSQTAQSVLLCNISTFVGVHMLILWKDAVSCIDSSVPMSF